MRMKKVGKKRINITNKQTKILHGFLLIGFLVIGLILILGTNNTIAEGTGNFPAPQTGDWIIDNETRVWNETIFLNGNLTITDDGNLTFKNVTLIMNCSEDGEFGITVNNGAEFYIFDYDINPETTNDRSNISANNTEYEFIFLVDNGSVFEMRNSELSECGYQWWGDDGREGLTIKTSNSTIENSTLYNNFFGINLLNAYNCKIIYNEIFNNKYGIILNNSINSYLTNNKIFNNSAFGIGLIYCDNNFIIENTIYSNHYGISISKSNIIQVVNNIVSEHNADGIYLFYSNNSKIMDNNILNNSNGLILSSSNNNQIINSYIFNNYGGIGIGNSLNNVVENSSISNSSMYDIDSGTNVTVTVINSTFVKNNVYIDDENSTITVKWYHSIQVLDRNQNPIKNANVRIQDNENSTYDVSYLTNSDGWIKWINLTEYIQNSTSKTFYTPYTIRAEKKGIWNETTIIMNETKEIVIILEEIGSDIVYVDDDNKGFENGSLEYPFNTIQEAVDTAKEGYTIYIFNGIYYENVNIQKRIDLIGENKDFTIIDGMGKGSCIFLNAYYVTSKQYIDFKNLNLRNGDKGINLDNCYFINIINNIIHSNKGGVYLYEKCEYVNILSNEIYNNDNAIVFFSNSNINYINYPKYIIIENNNINNNNISGITLRGKNNKILNNKISNNNIGFDISSIGSGNIIKNNSLINNGIKIESIYKKINIVENNTLNGKKIYFLSNVHGTKNSHVIISDDAGQILLYNCSYIEIKNNNISNGYCGIFAVECENISISNNIISNNNGYEGGIYFYNVDNSVIQNNNIFKNNHFGVYLYSLNNNVSINNNEIYGNLDFENHWGIGIFSKFSNNNINISNNFIYNNSLIGIRFFRISLYTNTTIFNNKIYDNKNDGLSLYLSRHENTDNIIILKNEFYNNNKCGINNTGGEIIDAKNNWWGDNSGPFHPTLNPTGKGDNVSDYVDFIPWIGYKIPITFYVDDDNTGFEDGSLKHPFNTIQEAVDSAKEEYTIYVFKGEYYEEISITKSIVLEGENQEETRIYGKIYGNQSNIKIRNFTILNTKESLSGYGIELDYHSIGDIGGYHIENLIIENINISEFRAGIDFNGCFNITVRNSTFEKNEYGLRISAMFRNILIENCSIRSNKRSGIHIWGEQDESGDYKAIIRYCDIENNKFYGLNSKIIPLIDARFNWWADSTGPYHEIENPEGKGENIWTSDGAIYLKPWLVQPVHKIIKAPDLTLTTSGIWIEGTPKVNETIRIKVKIHNIGGIKGIAKVKIYDGEPKEDDSNLIGFSTISVQPMDNYTLTEDWTPLKKGNHTIYVIIEKCEPQESNTLNNQATKNIFVKLEDKKLKSYIPSTKIIAITTAICIGATIGFFLVGTEIGLYKFYLAIFLPLYFKLTKKDIEKRLEEDKFTVGSIFGSIKTFPGITYTGIKKTIGLNNGTVTHHLNRLEKMEFIKSKRIGRHKHFYPVNMEIPEEDIKLNQTQLIILRKIEEKPGISPIELASGSEISKQLANYHLRVLSSAEPPFIKLEKSGRNVKCYLALEDGKTENGKDEFLKGD